MSTSIGPSKRVVDKSGRQYQKSQSTKEAILNAAVHCFVNYGYHKTTALKIAEVSQLSRGAMRHHYESKIDITKAAIEFLYEKRLHAFSEAIANIPSGADTIVVAVQAFWKQVNHPLYMAFFELSVASRTDKELADILHPAENAFNETYLALAAELFPEWNQHPDTLRVAMNLSRYLLEGMAVDAVARDSSDAQDELLLLERMLRELRNNPDGLSAKK